MESAPGATTNWRFRLPSVPLYLEMDARVQARVLDGPIGRDIRAPLRFVVADKIVAVAGKPVESRYRRRGVCPGKVMVTCELAAA